MARLVNKQFNTPIGLYSESNIREVIQRDSQVLANGAVGVNFSNPGVGKPSNLQNSAVLRMLEEEEHRQRSAQSPSNGDSERPLRDQIKWPPSEFEHRNQLRSSFKDVVIPGLKRVAWPPPEGDYTEQAPIQSQGGPQYSSQPPNLQNNHSPAHQQVSHDPSHRYPLKPLDISNGTTNYQPSAISPLVNQTPVGFRPTTPNKQWAPVHSPVTTPGTPQFKAPGPQYYPQSPQQYQSPTPNYQPAPQTYQPQQYNQPPPQQYQPPPQQYQHPPQQYQPPQQQYQPPPQQYQPPQQQYQPPPQQYQPPQQQYQAPQQQYQPPQHQYQPPQQQYQPPPQQQYQPQQYQPPPQVSAHSVSASPSQNPPQQYQQPPQAVKQVQPPPSTITLRPQAPVSQAPPPVVTSQPATATLKGGKNLRGDLKWPPENVKKRFEEENLQRIALAKGPAFKPRLVRKDYGPFFEQHALNASYPGYKVPPGTQFYEHNPY